MLNFAVTKSWNSNTFINKINHIQPLKTHFQEWFQTYVKQIDSIYIWQMNHHQWWNSEIWNINENYKIAGNDPKMAWHTLQGKEVDLPSPNVFLT